MFFCEEDEMDSSTVLCIVKSPSVGTGKKKHLPERAPPPIHHHHPPQLSPKMPSYASNTSQEQCASNDTASSIVQLATVTTVALVLAASWKIVLWRARAYAKYLEEKASTLRTDGTPMVGLSLDISSNYMNFFHYSFWCCSAGLLRL
jgi:hypothetical protein